MPQWSHLPLSRVTEFGIDHLLYRIGDELVARMLAAPDWSGTPVWVHGDLMPGNMLVHEGRLSAVIDFDGLGLGDPAAELVPYWLVLGPAERAVFRDRVGQDVDTWRRARGWASGPAITGIP